MRGRAGGYRGLQNDACGLTGAAAGPRMRTENDAIARFETDQGLENGRGSWVSDRNDSADNADWFCESDGAGRFILLQNAAGALIFVFVVDIFAGKVILDDFVFHNAHGGLFKCQLGKMNASVAGCQRRAAKDEIYLLLGVACEASLRGSYLIGQGVKIGYSCN